MTKKVKKEVQLVLTQTIQNLGKAGSLVVVRSGFARNYLIPQQKGEIATPEAIKTLESKQKELEANEKAEIDRCIKNKSILEQTSQYILQKRIGEDNKIFGKITVKQVRDLIEEKTKLNLSDSSIDIPEIKELGIFSVDIKLHATVQATIKIQILPQ